MTNRPFPSYWLYRDNQDKWRGTYHAKNGEEIAVSSESYNRRADCEHGIALMKASVTSETWGPTEDMKITN